MRKQLLGIFLLLSVTIWMTAGETQNTGGAKDNLAALQKVNIVRASDGVLVEIAAHGQVSPTVTTLENPSRICRIQPWQPGKIISVWKATT